MASGTVQTLESVVVPVLRNVTGHTDRVVPECAVRTHAVAGRRVVNHVQRTRLAYLRSCVEMLGGVAGCTLCPVEERSSGGAGHATAGNRIVDHMVLAKYAGLLSVVEVFGDETGDAVGCVPVGTYWAVASAVDEDLSARTGQTVVDCGIPESVVGTGGACGAVEVGGGLGTVHAFLESNVVYLVAGAESTNQKVEIEVPREKAGNAVGPVEVVKGVGALARVC